ncbi:MAG: cyanoexosortase A system-associated protein [Oscillatoriophycideae cyanobacterium NC_groundwater_1537_Pr4_S-0.65um_50_18]|nr:cyanoexosortase A system-associated protein [Oscillatoriophycideae cyanobacterium NC_groundwater_1537_Pr4_S-0.65um_50_18]
MIASIRLTLLRLSCLSVFLTVSKLALDPAAGQRAFTTFVFPETLPVSGWQLVQSQPLRDRRADSPQYDWVVSGRHYFYQRSELQQSKLQRPELQQKQGLEIEVRYVVNTDGNISQFMKEQKAIALDTTYAQIKTDLGTYSRFIGDHQVHLTSCIDSEGSSTVTTEQFFQNRYLYARKLDRLIAWSLGRNDLLDKRCLWIALSLSDPHQNSDQMAAALETLWHDQVMVWRSQFPQP